MVEFGEKVLAKLVTRVRAHGRVKQQKKKLTRRSMPAVWVGQMVRTGEHVCILANGNTIRCRTTKRVPFEDRWNADMIFNVIGIPRLLAPGKHNPNSIDTLKADEGHVEEVEKVPRAPREDDPTRVFHEIPEGQQREVDARELRITDCILEKIGGPEKYTPGCLGCDAKQAGTYYSKGHSKECRQRIYEAMEKSAEGRALLARRR